MKIVLCLKIFIITFVISVDLYIGLLYQGERMEEGRGSVYIRNCICKYIYAPFIL